MNLLGAIVLLLAIFGCVTNAKTDLKEEQAIELIETYLREQDETEWESRKDSGEYEGITDENFFYDTVIYQIDKETVYAHVLSEHYVVYDSKIFKDSAVSELYAFSLKNGKITSYQTQDKESDAEFPENVLEKDRLYSEAEHSSDSEAGESFHTEDKNISSVDLAGYKAGTASETFISGVIEGNLRSYTAYNDGTYECDGQTYKNRLIVSGQIADDANIIKLVFLSNLEDISFDRAFKAIGFSSSTDDYFSKEEAVLVEWINEDKNGNQLLTYRGILAGFYESAGMEKPNKSVTVYFSTNSKAMYGDLFYEDGMLNGFKEGDVVLVTLKTENNKTVIASIQHMEGGLFQTKYALSDFIPFQPDEILVRYDDWDDAAGYVKVEVAVTDAETITQIMNQLQKLEIYSDGVIVPSFGSGITFTFKNGNESITVQETGSLVTIDNLYYSYKDYMPGCHLEELGRNLKADH